MLAGLGGGDDRVGVEMVGQADVDGVDQTRAEHRAIVREDLRAARALGETTGVPGIDVGDRRHLGGVGHAEVAVDMRAGDATGPDDPEPDACALDHAYSFVPPAIGCGSMALARPERADRSAASTSVVRSSARSMFSVARVPSAIWASHCSNGVGPS